MFKKKERPAEEKALLDSIASIHSQMEAHDADSSEYAKMGEQLKAQYSILTELRKEEDKFKPWIPVIGHIAGIGLIVIAEGIGSVLTSKALNLSISPLRK